MRIVIAALALLLAGCAGVPRGAPVQRTATPPPARYDHPYRGDLHVLRDVSPAALASRCSGFATRVHACSYGYRDGAGHHCFVYTRAGSPYSYGSLLRHELGHCNGWNDRHSN